MKHNIKQLMSKYFQRSVEENATYILKLIEELQQRRKELLEKQHHGGRTFISIDEILGEPQGQPETKYTTLEIPEDLKEALDRSVISPIDARWDALHKEGED